MGNMYGTNCTYTSMPCAWANATTKGQHMRPWWTFSFSPLFRFFFLLAAFLDVFLPEPVLAGTSAPAQRLSRLDIAGSVGVVIDLPCSPVITCSGCLTLLLSFFLFPFLLFCSLPTPTASPPNLWFLVHQNKACKVAQPLTLLLNLVLGIISKPPQCWIRTMGILRNFVCCVLKPCFILTPPLNMEILSIFPIFPRCFWYCIRHLRV